MADLRRVVGAGILALTAVGSLHALQQSKQSSLKDALILYRQNRLAEALPLFDKAVTEDSTNPTTIAWQAETLRRLERYNLAVTQARRALTLSPCNAFAHEVLAAAYNPQHGVTEGNYDSVWVHLRRAVDCDPEDGNGWLNIWSEAMRRADRATEERALRRLAETGFLSRTAFSYNRWLLRDLPPNAVALSNGDLDTYPALSPQLTQGLRRDVAVVNLPMLNLWWYVLLLHERYGLPLPPDSSTLATRPMCGSGGADTVCLSRLVLIEWRRRAVDGRLGRPFAAFEDDMFPPGPGVFVRIGPLAVLRDTSPSFVDTTAIARSLRGIEGRDFADPGTTLMDRSAIRVASVAQKGMALHVAWVADLYGRELLRARRLREARDVLAWLRRFARNAELDTGQARDLIETYAQDLEAAGREP